MERTKQILPDHVRYVANVPRRDENCSKQELARIVGARLLLETDKLCLADSPEQRPCYKCEQFRLPDGEQLCDRNQRLQAQDGTIKEL